MTPVLLLWLAAAAAPEPKAAASEPKPGAAPETLVGPATGMRFVRIPAGRFRMGSPDTEPDRRSDEGPVHEVTITRPFLLGTCEVTVGQFRKFVEETGYKTDAERSGRGSRALVPGDVGRFRVYTARNWDSPGFEQTDDHPVTCVSWNDAVEFCKWLSRKEGRTCRLPTEAEWEYAARAGAAGRWPTGEDPEALAGHANVRDKAYPTVSRIHQKFGFDDGIPFTAPAAKYKANGWGLHDMIGNVWEWCADGVREYAKDPVADPRGPDSGPRVIRGGSFFAGPEVVRLAVRSCDLPDDRSAVLGFRVLMEVAPADKKGDR